MRSYCEYYIIELTFLMEIQLLNTNLLLTTVGEKLYFSLLIYLIYFL